MYVLLILYALAALVLVLYGINCQILTWLYRRGRKRQAAANRAVLDAFYQGNSPESIWEAVVDQLPVVTTQIPIFNEMNVAERVMESVAAFQYPAGLHEIQVLDDSTDETRKIVDAKAAELRQRGVDIKVVRRPERKGYKAGALAYGLNRAKGDIIVIFDADFSPESDFLLRSMPFFVHDAELGLVQARWGHVNRGKSLLTRLQAIGIDGHFLIEQAARSAGGLLMNFNGTAGAFRRQAIIDAGGWQTDTLTEDMDLSYRMQLVGWKCRYLPELRAPAEIPEDIDAFKSQQFRWARGSIQTAIKLLPRVMRSRLRPFIKYQAMMHMTHYIVHPLMLFLATLAPVMLLWGGVVLPTWLFALLGSLLLLSCSGPSILYLTAETHLGKSFWGTVLYLPFLICLGCGMAVNNSRAVLGVALKRNRDKSGEFIRTPKRGNTTHKFYIPKRSYMFVPEIVVGLWCLTGVAVYFQRDHYLVGHFLLLYATGFVTVGLLSLLAPLRKRA